MKKILHVENTKRVTGSFKILLHIIQGGDKKITSIVALPKKSQNHLILKKSNIKWIKFNFIELRKNLGALILYVPMLFYNAFRVWQYCRKNDIRIIHNNDHYNLVPIVIKFFLGSRVKLIVHVMLLPSTYNGMLYNVYRFLNNRYADHIVALSNAVARAYRIKDKVTIINGAYPLKECLPAYELRRRDVFKFLYIANYIKGKGQDHALKAFSRVKNKYPSVQLHFYGNTMGLQKNQAFKESLIAEAKSNGINGSVFFNDFSADVERTYKEYDVSLMFSESESFSMVSFESLYYGIPAIATDCGGPTEIIDHMQDGIIVPNKDVAAMAEAMEHLYHNESLRYQFSKQGKTKVLRLIREQPNFFAIADAL